MDRDNLKSEIRKEVIAELMPVYIAAFEELKAKSRIVAEKEKIYDDLFKSYFDMLAAERALRIAEQEIISQQKK